MLSTFDLNKELLILLTVCIAAFVSCSVIPQPVVFSLISGLPLKDYTMLVPIVLGAYWSFLFLFRASFSKFKSAYLNIMLIVGLTVLLIALQTLVEHWNIKSLNGYMGYKAVSFELKNSGYNRFLDFFSVVALFIVFVLGVKTGNVIDSKHQHELKPSGD